MKQDRGVTLLLVLILLTVLLLGGLAFTRMTETGVLLSGNVALSERAAEASEVGINTAYQRLQSLPDENASSSPWYHATMLGQTPEGLPTGVDWDAMPALSVGSAHGRVLTVRYVVERMCTASPPADTRRDCLVRQVDGLQTAKVGTEQIDPALGRQFRITVRVTDERIPGLPVGRTFVQALVTRG